MKIKGKTIEGPNVELIVIPRSGGDIPFECRAVLDFDDFDKMCPDPEPTMKLLPGGVQVPNMEDPKYIAAIEAKGEKRIAWMVVKSLEATEGLEWDTIKMDDPETWGNYRQELQDAGLTFMEITRIITTVMAANSLDETKLEEARKRFLAAREEETQKP